MADLGDGTLSQNEGTMPESRRLTKQELINACANFKALLNDPDAVAKNAGNFIRAMSLPVDRVQAVLDKTQGDRVNLYYGVMDTPGGEHFIFMAPGDVSLNGDEITSTESSTVLSLFESTSSTSFTTAVSDCLGKTPPCPEITNEFVN